LIIHIFIILKKKSGEEGEIEEEEDDYIDDDTRREDATIKQSLETVMREYSREMNQRALEAKEQAARDALSSTIPILPNPSMPQIPIPSNTIVNPIPDNSSSSNSTNRRADPAAGLDDEEGKRNLISSEIQMFRDRFKDEDTKMRNTEKERKDRYERERALQREKRAAEETPTSGNNKSAVSPSSRHTPPPPPSSRDRSSPRRDHHSSSSSRRDRPSPNDDRYRGSSSRNNTSNSVRSRASDRRSPPPSRYDRRSPVPPLRPYGGRRSRTKSPISKGHPNNEDDDETYERKRQERRLREKEFHYREVS
jgi:hypothetical protein